MRRGPVRLLLGFAVAIFVSSTGVMAARLADSPGEPLPRAAVVDVPATSDAPGPAGPAPDASSPASPMPPRTEARTQWAAGTGKASADPSPSGLPLKVVVKPPCGRHGDRLTAVVDSSPHAHLSLAVAYSDGQSHGDWHIGATDERGRLRFSWMVPPQAAEGPGVVLVAASDDKRSGTASEEFVVAGPAGC